MFAIVNSDLLRYPHSESFFFSDYLLRHPTSHSRLELTFETDSTQQNTQLQLEDNFDDYTFYSSIWEKIEVNGGVVTEKDGRLQVTAPDSNRSWEDWYWSQAGYVTKYPISTNSTSGFETSVNVVQLDHVSRNGIFL